MHKQIMNRTRTNLISVLEEIVRVPKMALNVSYPVPVLQYLGASAQATAIMI